MLKLAQWLSCFILIQWIGCSHGQNPPPMPPPVFPPLPPSNIPQNTIVCNSTYTRIWFSDTTLRQLNSQPVRSFFLARNNLDTSPNGSQCVSMRDGNANVINLGSNRVDCAYEVWTNSDYVRLTYLVRFVYAPVGRILRSFSYEFFLNCTYPRILNVSSERLKPIHKENRIKAPTSRRGEFNVTFTRQNRYFNQTFTLTGTDSIPTPVYVAGKLQTASNDANLILQATSCYATPTANRDDPIRFYIISNSCPVPDPDRFGTTTVSLNYAGRYVNFKFDTFYWGHIGPIKSRIYVHCCFRVCDQRLSSTCTSSPCPSPGRRKRSLTMSKDDEIKTTLGPIILDSPEKHYHLSRKPEKPAEKVPAQEQAAPKPDLRMKNIARGVASKLVCDKKKHGCSYNCAQLNTEAVACICPPGFSLAEDGKACYHLEIERKTHLQNSLYNCLKTPILAVIFTFFCYVFIFIKKSANSGK